MAITPVSDKSITRQVSGKIAQRGLNAPCRILVDTLKGQVTLSGTVQYAHQKLTAVQAASGISGVRRIIDKLTVKAAPRY